MRKFTLAIIVVLLVALLAACSAPAQPAAPKAEAPKAEAPKTEAPKADAKPKAEAPKAEAPKAEAPKPAASKEPYKIGVIASLTGPAAPIMVEYNDGFKAYVREWNKRGGVNGREVVLETLDDETNATSSVNAFRKLGSDPKINAIWFAVSSNSVMAMKPLASELKVPIVSGGAVDAIGLPADPYLFKVAPGTNAFMIALVKWASEQGMKRIATINPDDAYGQSEMKYMVEFAPKFGVEVVAKESHAVADTNFNAQLVKIRDAKPDLVYSGATGASPPLVVKQYRQLGLQPTLSLSQGAFTKAFFDAVGQQAAEGIVAPTNVGTLGDQMGGDEGKLFKDLSTALGRNAMLFNTFGWDHGLITEHAIKNSDGTREGIRAAMDKIKDLPGINGPITFVPNNHIGQDERGLTVAKYSGGKFVLIKKER